MLQGPMAPGTVGARSNSENKVMRENILTPIAKGDLCWVRQHQNFRTRNTQSMSKIFQFLQKKLGMSASGSTFILHVLVDESRHPSSAELFDEFGDLQEHKIRGD